MRTVDAGKVLLFTAALLFAACDQTGVTFPDGGTGYGGQCGEWYPGGAAGDGGVAEYAIEQDATFPCLVWNSVREDGQDTWINAGELFLEVQNGVSDKKALVILLSSTGCPACLDLVNGITDRKDEYDAAAIMVGAALADATQEEGFTLDGAEDQLVNTDGWPTEWMVTNDAEGHLPGYESFPWIIVVRLSDMKVIEHNNQSFSGANTDDLIELIQSF